eukprot:jgi/Mesen1/3475/ME000195S02623
MASNGDEAGPGRPSHAERDRRQIRAIIKKIGEELIDEREEVKAADGSKYIEKLEKLNAYQNRALRPREQTQDVAALKAMASLLVEGLFENIRRDGPSLADFVRALQRLHGSNAMAAGDDAADVVSFDWDTFSMDAAEYLTAASGVATMLGPMDLQAKNKKSYTRRKRERPTETVVPEELQDKAASGEKKETDTNMEVIYGLLRRQRAVPFTALVLNRESFAQTVENIFSLSFLIRDGLAAFSHDGKGDALQVEIKKKPTQEQRGGGVRNAQFALRIDYSDWEELKKMVPAGGELMPHRPAADQQQHPSGGGEPPCASGKRSQTPVRKHSRNRARETSMSMEQAPESEEPEEEESVQEVQEVPSSQGKPCRRRKH